METEQQQRPKSSGGSASGVVTEEVEVPQVADALSAIRAALEQTRQEWSSDCGCW